MKKLLTGNEAAAQGAYEAGVSVATGYPGTPSTEVLEFLMPLSGVYAEWSANEKTALEMASGASFGGKRALGVMKHVGLNAAADPLMTLSYTGVRAGLVIVVSDDPGMHSSQNEQDSRLYGRFAKVPVLEPSDSEEALAFTKEAFSISEEFDIPVIVRLTAAVSHSASLAQTGRRTAHEIAPWKEPRKYVMLPPYCNERRGLLEERLRRLKEFSDSFPHNRAEFGSPDTGIVTAGISYQYVKEAFPEASVFKVSMSYPMPLGAIKEFSKKVKRLSVIEELEPYMEDAIRAGGIEVRGQYPISQEAVPPLPHGELSGGQCPLPHGELSVSSIKKSLAGEMPEEGPILGEGGAFCAGCPYLGVFYCLKRTDCFVFGDIGCYTMGALLFPGSMDTTLCMGAGISQAVGFLKARPEGRAFAVIGDSTFFHSGIPAVINALHHKTPLPLIILDNGVTAMTGGQSYAGKEINLKGLLHALGLKDVGEINPYDIKSISIAIHEALNSALPSAIIIKGRCAVKERPKNMAVDPALCDGCMECLELKCPALVRENGAVAVRAGCTGCGLCASVCRRDAVG